MPFGLKNAAQAFQRLMDGILHDLNFVFVYLDDILIASCTNEEHEAHLCDVFRLLSDNAWSLTVRRVFLVLASSSILGTASPPQVLCPLSPGSQQ